VLEGLVGKAGRALLDHLSSAALGEAPEALAQRGRARLGKHPMRALHGLKEVARAQQHLDLAQHEISGLVHREVQPLQDPPLRLGVEVHQGVAAQQQVGVRDRRVLEKVVAAEDERPAHVGADHPPLAAVVVGGEVAVPKLGGHRLEGRLRVHGATSLLERLLVDVRGVDLRAIGHHLGAQQLGQQHGDRVGLLAAGTPGAPHPHRLAGWRGLQQPGQHLVAQVLPHLRVAEELGDVDQDGVEQGRELVGVDLEKVEVGRVALNADGLHAAVDASLQAGALVAGEVEPTVVAQIGQQLLKLLGHGALSHRNGPRGQAGDR